MGWQARAGCLALAARLWHRNAFASKERCRSFRACEREHVRVYIYTYTCSRCIARAHTTSRSIRRFRRFELLPALIRGFSRRNSCGCLVCGPFVHVRSFERSRAQLRQPRNAVQTDRGALLARVFRKRERSQRHGTALDVCSRIERVLIERQRTRVSRMAGVRGRSNIRIPLSLIIDSYRRSTNIYIYILLSNKDVYNCCL